LVSNITAFALSFFLCSAFTPLVRGIAVKLDIGNKPNGRGNRNIAHIGGISIIGAILFALIPVYIFFLDIHPINRVFFPIFVASGFLIFLLGIIDDLRSLHYIYKLMIQIMVSVFVAAFGIALLGHFNLIQLPIVWGVIAFIAVSIWMLGITTSFNLIDGLDGLASGLAFVYSMAFAIEGLIFNLPLVVFLSLIVAGAAISFLRFNFPPAKIFMGDSGSLFLGLVFGLIPLLTIIKAESIFYNAAGSIVILSIPLLDTSLAFSRRLLAGRPVFEADHLHIHHILLRSLKSVRKVDFLLWGLAAIDSYLGLSIMRGNTVMLAVAIALDAAIFVVALRVMVRSDVTEEGLQKIYEH